MTESKSKQDAVETQEKTSLKDRVLTPKVKTAFKYTGAALLGAAVTAVLFAASREDEDEFYERVINELENDSDPTTGESTN